MAQTQAQKRASDAVAAWLAKHNRNPAWLVDETHADPGTIGDFLNQNRWPKIGTQGRIEKALGWPDGIIRQIGNGADVPAELLEATSRAGTSRETLRQQILASDRPEWVKRAMVALLDADVETPTDGSGEERGAS